VAREVWADTAQMAEEKHTGKVLWRETAIRYEKKVQIAAKFRTDVS
jgi:hypothetical protein